LGKTFGPSESKGAAIAKEDEERQRRRRRHRRRLFPSSAFSQANYFISGQLGNKKETERERERERERYDNKSQEICKKIFKYNVKIKVY